MSFLAPQGENASKKKLCVECQLYLAQCTQHIFLPSWPPRCPVASYRSSQGHLLLGEQAVWVLGSGTPGPWRGAEPRSVLQ